MDHEKLVAALLLRGFKKYRNQSNHGSDMYVLQDTAVIINKQSCIVGIAIYDADAATAMVDWMLKGDQP